LIAGRDRRDEFVTSRAFRAARSADHFDPRSSTTVASRAPPRSAHARRRPRHGCFRLEAPRKRAVRPGRPRQQLYWPRPPAVRHAAGHVHCGFTVCSDSVQIERPPISARTPGSIHGRCCRAARAPGRGRPRWPMRIGSSTPQAPGPMMPAVDQDVSAAREWRDELAVQNSRRG